MGKISPRSRYVIDIIGMDPLSLGELGDFQCFGEFGAFGRSRTMKICRLVRDLHELTYNNCFPDSPHLGGWKERKN